MGIPMKSAWPARMAVCGVLALMVAVAASHARACGALEDPMSANCVRGQRPQAAMPMPPVPAAARPSPPGQQGAAYPKGVAPLDANNRRQCALYDVAADRCVVRKSTPEEYDRAVQTGIDAAHSAMGIQADVIRRAGGGGPASAASCVSDMLARLQASGRPVTSTDHAAAKAACGQR